MKITKSQLRRIIREQVEEEVEQTQPSFSPELQAALDQLEDFTVDELYKLASSATEAWRKKDQELKSSFKKGDRVEFDHEGEVKTGEVVRRGGKFVVVAVDGWEGKPWKRWASSLRKA